MKKIKNLNTRTKKIIKKNIKKIIYTCYLSCVGVLWGISLLFLSGCEKVEPNSVITIDKYILNLYTPHQYHLEQDTEQLDPVIQKYLIALYTLWKEKTFNDSILVFKIPNTYKDLDDFVTRNTEHITEPRYSEKDSKTTSIDDCATDIPLIVRGSAYENEEENTYFVQGFFLDGDDAYLISAGTENEDIYDQLYDDFKNLSCQNNESNEKD